MSSIKRLVARRGHQRLWPVALVQHQPLEHRLAVDQDLVAGDRHRPQTGVAVDAVDHRAAVVDDHRPQVVQVRVGRRPKPPPIVRHGEGQPWTEVEAEVGLGGDDLALVVAEHDSDAVARTAGADLGVDRERGAGRVRRDLEPAQVNRGNRLEPHGLPDARWCECSCTPGSRTRWTACPRAWTSCGRSRARTVIDASRPRGHRVGDVDGERAEAAAVPTDLDLIDPHGRVVVDGAEVEQHALPGPLDRHRHGAAIPDGVQEVGVLPPRTTRSPERTAPGWIRSAARRPDPARGRSRRCRSRSPRSR